MRLLVVLAGTMCSGKSTLSADIIRREPPGKWQVVSQDDIAALSGHVAAASVVLQHRSENVLIDRINSDEGQRREFVQVAKAAGVMCICIYLNPPVEDCVQRLRLRGDGHPRFRWSPNNAAIIRQTHRHFSPPSLSEGFAYVWEVTTDHQRDCVIDCLLMLSEDGGDSHPTPCNSPPRFPPKKLGRDEGFPSDETISKRRRLEEELVACTARLSIDGPPPKRRPLKKLWRKTTYMVVDT
eukprot:Sspe_Gene.66442::Locus_39253_Transcript_1_1_Confidence_1.000_Length_3004::g.66442::m.66442